MPEIYIYLVSGRDQDVKRSLMTDITNAVVKNTQVPPESVIIQIIESAPADKMKGGETFEKLVEVSDLKATPG